MYARRYTGEKEFEEMPFPEKKKEIECLHFRMEAVKTAFLAKVVRSSACESDLQIRIIAENEFKRWESL